MTFALAIWRCIIILLLNFSIQRRPLLLVGCLRFITLGNLTVEPALPFLLGSNLTVYCHIPKCQERKEWSKVSLVLDDKTVKAVKKDNCTTVFHLPKLPTPKSKVFCIIDQLSKIVSGLNLHGGLPPDKPVNVTCDTTRSSDFIDCSWEKKGETHLSTTYNISVNSENGTQIHLDQIQDAEKITIPRGILDKDTKYQLIITAYNHLGASRSDPFIWHVKDIVIPETPHILQIDFGNSSVAAVLRWETTESSVHLRPYIRLRTRNGHWEVRQGTELSDVLIRVNDLRPLTEYEFQMRTCDSSSGLTHASTPSFAPRLTSRKTLLCSKWSSSMTGISPGKGPSQQLSVWRMFNSSGTNGLTVLWKPPPPGDYSGEVHQYRLFLTDERKREVNCPANVSQYALTVSAELQAVSVSAVTSYGSSPPADVPLRHSGAFGPVLRQLAANGSAVLVSWSWPWTRQGSTSEGELLHYVVEWISVTATELQWQKLAKNQTNTSITGLTAGVRYNISLYAVTTRGVSAPSSGLVYSKEQKPLSGPSMSVLIHKPRQILILWDELPVNHQRGFITNYTLYVQAQDSSKATFSETVSASGPRQKWFNCPEGALALQLTASNSAGEGPRGSWIFSQPSAPAAGPVIVIALIIAFLIVVIANLMCWSCVRERIKQKCLSCGPAWLVENLPKPGNSNAIRLLEQDGSEPSFSSIHSDPPLSPISLISWEERDDVYPTIRVEVSQTGSGQPVAETPLLASDTGTMLGDAELDRISYRPQVAPLASQGEETEEEQRAISVSGEEDKCSSVFGGLVGGLLSSVEVDFSDSPLGPTLSSVGGLLFPKTPETTIILNGAFLVGRRETEGEVAADSPSLELQQSDIMTPDLEDTCLFPYTDEMKLTAGYFPQVAAISSGTLCDTQS
ncbi:interleukin-12 receptor subunit beta-2-like [Lates japonicus]|uniref:Interleukin-12 receptor subunit beta-2-like protein n=1 Tax=Lates japonicus TaxID=270547 RepID=A0AAD3MA13_LATJO|nr:interleukin-12 receptor subunit beta-2-like protein [Lates japonicus]